MRSSFGVSSPRPKPQLATPQPTAPTENIEYEIPLGMIEQLLANPYAGDGTEHPDMHLIYVEQICGLFKLAGLPEDEVMRKVFPLSLKGKALAWYRLCDDIGSWNWNRLKLEFHQKITLCILFIVIAIIYIISGLVKENYNTKEKKIPL